MKIIKEGTKGDRRRWEGFCSKCGSVVEAEQWEIVTKCRRVGEIAYAVCPACPRVEPGEENLALLPIEPVAVAAVIQVSGRDLTGMTEAIERAEKEP